MSHSANAGNSATTRQVTLENVIGFITFSAVSIGAVFLLATAISSVVEQMMRYSVIEVSRAFGGVI